MISSPIEKYILQRREEERGNNLGALPRSYLVRVPHFFIVCCVFCAES